ncbi:MAG: PA2779 family protein [Thermodesulfobacteriota bacterium]
MIRYIAKPLSLFLIFSFILLDFTAITAKAGLIGTEAVFNALQGEKSRSRITAFLDRQDVQKSFLEKGIDPLQAKKRVASLTDQEVSQICKALDQLPAGGDGAGAVVGAILLIFLILLLTDILGFTHVFPFVKHTR